MEVLPCLLEVVVFTLKLARIIITLLTTLKDLKRYLDDHLEQTRKNYESFIQKNWRIPWEESKKRDPLPRFTSVLKLKLARTITIMLTMIIKSFKTTLSSGQGKTPPISLNDVKWEEFLGRMAHEGPSFRDFFFYHC